MCIEDAKVSRIPSTQVTYLLPHNKKKAEIFIFSVVEVFLIPAIVQPPFSFLTFIFELRLISLLLHYGVGPMQSVLSQ